MPHDPKLNDAAIRLADLDRAMTWVRQNGAALGLGANLMAESLRAERDDLMAETRAAGAALAEEAERRHANERVGRHGGALRGAAPAGAA